MDGLSGIYAEKAHDGKRVKDADRHVGHRVMIYRELRGLTQQDVAKKLRLSFQQIQKFEKGQNRITPAYLLSLANILGTPVSSFFDGLPGHPETNEAVIAICEITKENPDVSIKEICNVYRELLKLTREEQVFVQKRIPAIPRQQR